MRRLLAYLVVIAIPIGVLQLMEAMPSSANGSSHHHYRHHYHAHVAAADVAPDFGGCRIGWWQTLRHGRVHPLWAQVCR